MKDIEIKDKNEKVIFSGEVEDIQELSGGKFCMIWFKSPMGNLLSEAISVDQLIIFSA